MLSISHHIIKSCSHHRMNHLRAAFTAREIVQVLISKYINVSILFVLVNDGRHNSLWLNIVAMFIMICKEEDRRNLKRNL